MRVLLLSDFTQTEEENSIIPYQLADQELPASIGNSHKITLPKMNGRAVYETGTMVLPKAIMQSSK